MLVTLNEVLEDARRSRYAVGLFNTTDSDMLEAAVSAAEELRSPIIIGTAEVLLPYGSLELIAPSMINAARRASIPVVVHFDHDLSFSKCMDAIRLGFSSLMFDGSIGELQKNIDDTAEIVRIAHSFGVSVEGEIGHIGETSSKDNNAVNLYTSVEDARTYWEATGVDALAVAVGTAHGVYRSKPRLDFERLREIQQYVGVPLVLHGGSGLSDDDFRRSVANGICKINIFTDLCVAGSRAIQEGLENGCSYLELRNQKTEAIKQEIMKKICLFGSAGHA